MKPAILALSATSWEGIRLSRQQLLLRLAARGWPVVYSDGALSLWERREARWRNAGWRASSSVADGVRIYRAGRWPFRWQRVPAWDRCVTRWHGRQMSRVAGRRQSPGTIVYLWHPQFLPYLTGLNHDWIVYHSTDINSKMPGFMSRDEAMESELVERADLVIGTSATIIRHLPGTGRERGQLLMSGSDELFFRGAGEITCPTVLAAIPRPRLGYVGHVNIKVDFTLVATIAELRPHWHWVFVGPVNEVVIESDPISAAAHARCRAAANVHFFGYKPYRELPAYEAHMDVNTLCYRVEESGWWIGLSPIKLYEYLAVGNPVVGSPLEAVLQHGEVVDLVTGVADWIAAIERALEAGGIGTPERRRAVAAANSWDQRADRLEKLLLEMIGNRTDRPGSARRLSRPRPS